MITFTTCRDCGTLLRVTNDDTVHPLCTPRPTKLERLLDDFLAAAQMGDQPELADDLEWQIAELEAAPPRLAEAALHYAAMGWPVFPLLSGGKAPATKHGFKDATTDASRIATWWRAHPSHNVGLPTGHAFDVIDVDLPDGPSSLEQLLAEDAGPNQIRCHGVVLTASGGRHLYVEPTGDPNGAGILAGVDYRGLGGYVVAPPSVTATGAWRWKVKPSPVITHG